MTTTNEIEKQTEKAEEDYWVPVTRTETRTAKIKVRATSPKQAQRHARAIVRCITPPTIMVALGELKKAKVTYGIPWQREEMEPETCPPVKVIQPKPTRTTRK